MQRMGEEYNIEMKVRKWRRQEEKLFNYNYKTK